MLLIILFYIGKLFALQVLDNEYNQLADNNAILPKYNILPVGLFTTGRGVWLSITNQRTTLW